MLALGKLYKSSRPCSLQSIVLLGCNICLVFTWDFQSLPDSPGVSQQKWKLMMCCIVRRARETMTHPVFFSSLLHTDLQFTSTTATARGKYFSILLKTLNGGRMTVRMIKADDDDKSNTLLSRAEQLCRPPWSQPGWSPPVLAPPHQYRLTAGSVRQKVRNENIGSWALVREQGGFIAICFVRENHQYRVEHDLLVRKGSHWQIYHLPSHLSVLIGKYLDSPGQTYWNW